MTTTKTHPAHTPNGPAWIGCQDDDGVVRGYVTECGSFGGATIFSEHFRPMRFSSFAAAEAFLMANPQWTPAVVRSIDPKVSTETPVRIRLLHNAAIPGARWCEPIGWEPANDVPGAEVYEGGWWDADSQVAGLVWFGEVYAYGSGEVIDADPAALRVASCGDCRVIGAVEA